MAQRFEYDFLIIGTGVAGLTFALGVSDRGSVAIITKKESAESNTNYAQGGIAGVLGDEDSFQDHIEDTLRAGAGLSDPEIVDITVREGPDRIRRLIELGASFSKKNGALHLGLEGGHSASRIVHAKDATGREIERALLDAIHTHSHIDVFEYHYAVDLITEHHLGQFVNRRRPDVRCYGAYVYDEQTDAVHTFLARVTMLASGGSSAAYLHTTNPRIATGDGVAMAYRAKARIANMEFVQFHPTSLYLPDGQSVGAPDDGASFLISEAVRGHGALLYTQSGHRFMPDYAPRAELAPRDIVARAIDDQLKRRGEEYVLLDISHAPAAEIEEHFPFIRRSCSECGFDITKEPIPVVPAAHYQCGGVQTDRHGRTSVGGLFASGEVACTGLHGANRLASNSLLEALVFSDRAVEPAVALAARREWSRSVPDWDATGTESPHEWVLVSHNRDELRRVMWNYVGIVRSEPRLKRALRRTKLLYEEVEEFYNRTSISSGLCELRNMIAVAYLIIRSAQMRRESRGLHYMADYPEAVESEKRPSLI